MSIERRSIAVSHVTKRGQQCHCFVSSSIQEDDIFASSTTPAASERRRPKKAVTKDETLFKDDTDIFADLPAAKPKENKKKKKTTEKKVVEQKDIGECFFCHSLPCGCIRKTLVSVCCVLPQLAFWQHQELQLQLQNCSLLRCSDSS